MYDKSNTQWFSQTLLTYKDKSYATEGYLRLSITSNTEDFKNFNPPSLNLSITNNFQKSVNLNIQNAKDLVKVFKMVLSKLNGEEINVQRKYQKDLILHLKFKIDENNQNRIVLIELRNNESDFTKIVIPLEGVFESLASCIREFSEQYMSICTQMFVQSIQSQTVQIIHQLPSLIKGISSQIISQIPADDLVADAREVEITDDDIAKTEATIEDLDKFLGADLSNIIVPELEIKKEEVITEVNSLFVKNFLKNDLYNLETLMTNYFMAASPLLVLASDIKAKVGSDIKDESFTCFPSIEENDLKSLVYLSKLFSSIVYQNYITSSTPMPATTPIFRYNPKSFDENNMEIAYDLLLFNLYIRSVRHRAESKLADAIQCKALFYIQLRCFTDHLVFSFIDKIDTSKISSILMGRYKYYNKIGVFDYYKTFLSEIKCPAITESDVLSTIDEVVDKVVGKTPYIEHLHQSMVKPNSLRIETMNAFTLEQIINEVLPLEIAEKTGKNLSDEFTIHELKQNYNISDEILNLFKEKPKQKETKKSTEVSEKVGNLERMLKFYIDEIPEMYRESFLTSIKELGENKFDLQTTTFPVDEFGDNVVKCLYLWDPEKNPVILKNYKKFATMVENEIMERDLILAKNKIVEKVESESSDWDFLSK